MKRSISFPLLIVVALLVGVTAFYFGRVTTRKKMIGELDTAREDLEVMTQKFVESEEEREAAQAESIARQDELETMLAEQSGKYEEDISTLQASVKALRARLEVQESDRAQRRTIQRISAERELARVNEELESVEAHYKLLKSLSDAAEDQNPFAMDLAIKQLGWDLPNLNDCGDLGAMMVMQQLGYRCGTEMKNAKKKIETLKKEQGRLLELLRDLK